MKHRNVKEKLIENTIKVIAAGGLDKTTTKAIVSGTGINEAYIYRFFQDKEDLLIQTFRSLDRELFEATMSHLPDLESRKKDCAGVFRTYFDAIWAFLIGNREKCLAFMRYYYSPYFTKHSAEEHKELFAPLVTELNPSFREKANVWMLLTHILCTMLDFAIKVFNGELSDCEDTREHVFRLIFFSVKPYFNKEI